MMHLNCFELEDPKNDYNRLKNNRVIKYINYSFPYRNLTLTALIYNADVKVVRAPIIFPGRA